MFFTLSFSKSSGEKRECKQVKNIFLVEITSSIVQYHDLTVAALGDRSVKWHIVVQ